MPRLTAMDEYFVHQIPEPLPNVETHHDFWRESLFFICHNPRQLDDIVILTLAHFPKGEVVDAMQLGRIGDDWIYARHERPYDGDPHTMAVGPVRVDIAEPVRTDRAPRRPARRRPLRHGRDVPRPGPGLRVAAGHDEGRSRAGVGPVAPVPVGRRQRHRAPGRHHARAGGLVVSARPLVGHPRPRPLPALDVVRDPGRRRHVRRLALGVPQRRPRVHRRLLRPRRRLRPDPVGRLPPRRPPLDGRGRQRGVLWPGRHRGAWARRPLRADARGWPDGQLRRRGAVGVPVRGARRRSERDGVDQLRRPVGHGHLRGHRCLGTTSSSPSRRVEATFPQSH